MDEEDRYEKLARLGNQIQPSSLCGSFRKFIASKCRRLNQTDSGPWLLLPLPHRRDLIRLQRSRHATTIALSSATTTSLRSMCGKNRRSRDCFRCGRTENSLPLVGEDAGSRTHSMQLEQEITVRLQAYMTDPEVTVIVQEITQPSSSTFWARFSSPELIHLHATTTVLDAIAVAGGFRDFAKQKDIYILRQNSQWRRSPASPSITRKLSRARTQPRISSIEPHDTVVVP